MRCEGIYTNFTFVNINQWNFQGQSIQIFYSSLSLQKISVVKFQKVKRFGCFQSQTIKRGVKIEV